MTPLLYFEPQSPRDAIAEREKRLFSRSSVPACRLSNAGAYAADFVFAPDAFGGVPAR